MELFQEERAGHRTPAQDGGAAVSVVRPHTGKPSAGVNAPVSSLRLSGPFWACYKNCYWNPPSCQRRSFAKQNGHTGEDPEEEASLSRPRGSGWLDTRGCLSGTDGSLAQGKLLAVGWGWGWSLRRRFGAATLGRACRRGSTASVGQRDMSRWSGLPPTSPPFLVPSSATQKAGKTGGCKRWGWMGLPSPHPDTPA